jgi:hypothetical protein
MASSHLRRTYSSHSPTSFTTWACVSAAVVSNLRRGVPNLIETKIRVT